MLPSRAEFRSLLETLSPAAFEAFVADLWRARGWDVVREGDRLVVTDRFGADHVALVCHGRIARQDVPTDVDILVTTSPRVDPPDADVVGPDDLYRLLRYAVDRETAADLVESTFDRDPTAEPSVHAGRGLDVADATSGFLLVASVVLVILGAAVVGAPSADRRTAADAGTVTGGTPQLASPAEQPDTPGPGVNEELLVQLPPGVDRNGSVRESVLARAHADALAGRSYRLVVIYREFRDGRPIGLKRETVAVESPSTYATRVVVTGSPSHEDYLLPDVEAYADGEARYERTVGGDDSHYHVRMLRSGNRTRYAERVDAYIRWFLSVRSSTVVDAVRRNGTTYYWLRLHGDPWSGVANTTGSALIDERGFVHSLHRRYDVPGAPVTSVAVTVRYTTVGNVSAEAPPWYTEAQNATA